MSGRGLTNTIITVLIAIGVGVGVGAPTTQADPKDPPPSQPTAEDLWKRGSDNFERNHYTDAIPAFQQLVLTFPTNEHAAPAQYFTGLSYTNLKDWGHAISAYQVLVEKYPDSSFADDGLYFGALAAKELKKCTEARADLAQLKQHYRNSNVSKQADALDQQLKDSRDCLLTRITPANARNAVLLPQGWTDLKPDTAGIKAALSSGWSCTDERTHRPVASITKDVHLIDCTSCRSPSLAFPCAAATFADGELLTLSLDLAESWKGQAAAEQLAADWGAPTKTQRNPYGPQGPAVIMCWDRDDRHVSLIQRRYDPLEARVAADMAREAGRAAPLPGSEFILEVGGQLGSMCSTDP